MQSFYEIRFPENISYGMLGGPEYSTTVVETYSGFEQRNINWPQARNRYNVSQGIKNENQLNELIAFFRICKGKAIGFRFKDWTDFNVINQLIAISDGNKRIFQLTKRYEIENSIETRIITKPVKGTVRIYINDRLINDNVIINYQNGEISFKTPPPNSAKITADFEFDVPVRFNNDLLNASIEDYNTYSWHNITLIEIRI